MSASIAPCAPMPQRRVRALVHLLRTPLAAARLRLHLAAHDLSQPPALADLEAALATFDAAVARLLPLAAGATPDLSPQPSDLVTIVLQAARAAGASGSLHTPAMLSGCWDEFAVRCILRNLLSLARDRPTSRLALTLVRAPGGASLSLLGSPAAPVADDARRWLIERLVRGHGGWASFSFEPGRLRAQLFLAGNREAGL